MGVRYTNIVLMSFLITFGLFFWQAVDPSEIRWASRAIGVWALTVAWWSNVWMTRQVVRIAEREFSKRNR